MLVSWFGVVVVCWTQLDVGAFEVMVQAGEVVSGFFFEFLFSSLYVGEDFAFCLVFSTKSPSLLGS